MNITKLIRYTIHESLVSRYLQDFQSNTFRPYHSAAFISLQYVLHNLPNIRLNYMSNNDLLSNLTLEGHKNINLNCPICSSIHFDVADTGMFFFMRYPVLENTHRSTPCDYGGQQLLSAVKDGTDRAVNQYSITGFSWEIWMIAALVTVMLSLLPVRGTWIKSGLRGCLWNFQDNLWFYLSHLLHNGFADLNPQLSFKIVFGAWMMTTFILMTAYSGNLKGTLLVETGTFVDSVDDLLQRKDLILHLMKNSQMEYSILYSEGHEYRKIRSMGDKRMSTFEIYGENYKSMMKSVASGRGVLFFYSPYRNKFAISLNDELRIFGTLVYFGNTKYEYDYDFLHFNKRMGQELLERVDYLCCRVLETAQYRMNLEMEDWKARTLLFSSKGAGLGAFTPMDCWFLLPVFRIWLFGMTVPALVIFLEIFIFPINNFNNNRNRKIYLK